MEAKYLAGAISVSLLLSVSVCAWTLFAVSGISLSTDSFASTLDIVVRSPSVQNLFSHDKLILVVIVPLIIGLQRLLLPLSLVAHCVLVLVGVVGVMVDGNFKRVIDADADAPLLLLDVACSATMIMINILLSMSKNAYRTIGTNAVLLLIQMYAVVCCLKPLVVERDGVKEIEVGGVDATIFFSMLTWSMITLSIAVCILQFNALVLLCNESPRQCCAFVSCMVVFTGLVFVNISFVSFGITFYAIMLSIWFLVLKTRIESVVSKLVFVRRVS